MKIIINPRPFFNTKIDYFVGFYLPIFVFFGAILLKNYLLAGASVVIELLFIYTYFYQKLYKPTKNK